MASKLNKSTNIARKALIVFLVFAIFTFIYGFITGNNNTTPQTVVPTQAPRSPYLQSDDELGAIPYPQVIPLPVTPQPVATYSIQDQAVLPSFPDVLNVYVINKPREKLGNTAKGIEVATQLELGGGGRIIADNVTLFQSEDTTRSLTYDKLYEKWNFETDITKEKFDAETLNSLRLNSDINTYLNTGNILLTLLKLSDSHFNSAPARASYINYNFSDKTIRIASSARTGQFVYIRQSKIISSADIDPNYRPSQGEPEIQTLNSQIRSHEYNKGIVNMIVRGTGKELTPELVAFDYHQLNYGEQGRYKSLTSRDAFLKLQNGEGFLYWLNLKGRDPFLPHEALPVLEFKVDASKTAIVYVQPEEWNDASPWTTYLQPYYLFEGTAVLTDGREADFAKLIPALDDTVYVK